MNLIIASGDGKATFSRLGVARLPAAYSNLHCSGFFNPAPLLGGEREMVGRQLKLHSAAFTGFEVQAPESFERAQRHNAHTVVMVCNIELRHLVAIDLAGIGNGGCHFHRFAGGGCGLTLDIAVSKGGVTQSVAKRIERFSSEIAVSSAHHRIAVEGRRSSALA